MDFSSPRAVQFGFVGGVGIAIGISLVNVVFSFLLGLGPARWINYRNWLVKFIALLVTIAGLCAIVALHGFAAHYRDAVAAVGEASGMAEAIRTIKTRLGSLPISIPIICSRSGLLFGLSAFYKGCTFDDPYPFYGKQARRRGSCAG